MHFACLIATQFILHWCKFCQAIKIINFNKKIYLILCMSVPDSIARSVCVLTSKSSFSFIQFGSAFIIFQAWIIQSPALFNQPNPKTFLENSILWLWITTPHASALWLGYFKYASMKVLTTLWFLVCIWCYDHEFFKMPVFPFSSLLVVRYEKAANAIEAIQKRTGRLN